MFFAGHQNKLTSGEHTLSSLFGHMTFINSIIYLISFFAIWIGSGIIISAVERLAKNFRASSFFISFVILGLLTSIPELAVGIDAVWQQDPEIFVGNLLGGIPVIFLFVIPILAILRNGISIKHELTSTRFFATAAVIIAPFLFILDKKISNPEGFLLIVPYIGLLWIVKKDRSSPNSLMNSLVNKKGSLLKEGIKIAGGILIVFLSGNSIVSNTLYFSQLFHVSPFYISLIVLSLGTNLPELTLAIQSAIKKTEDIAFGDYLGSAAVNSLLFGIFTLLSRGEVLHVTSNFLAPLFFILVGLGLFYLFARSKSGITRKEGIILLSIYVLFVILEIGKH